MANMGLNKEQREAVEYTEGPLLILAGAGSGKTRVLTHRVAKLVDMGVMAWQILAITFTNKAAREMRERIEGLVGERAGGMWVCTFHAACVRILRRDIERIGYAKSFTIYDDDDQMKVIAALLKEMDVSGEQLPPREIKSKISDAKNRLLSPDEWLREAGNDFRSRMIHRVFVKYEERLRCMNALDFDDLIAKTLQLFGECPDVLKRYQDQFRYVMVDEYQDTTHVQYRLVRLLSGGWGNLCVVGDDDQSIYGWRGADIRNILDFQKDFPGAKVVRLEQNYRSTAPILNCANAVIAGNKGRQRKTLWTERQGGEPPSVYNAASERDEAEYICRNIRDLHAQGETYSQMAVLYRMNAQSRVLEETMLRYNLPYRIYGGLRFYDRKEVKDLVAYLRVLLNPEDEVSLRRIINVPRRGVGDATIAALDDWAARNGETLMGALICADQIETLGRGRNRILDFADLISRLMTKVDDLPIGELVDLVMTETKFLEQFDALKDKEEAATRRENVMELVSAVKQFEAAAEDPSLSAFLESAALATDQDTQTGGGSAVTLMTMHSAKGLEFPVVFLPGMEEGVFPLYRATSDEDALAEERRLCYVGITRAMDRLFISHARQRTLMGQTMMNPPSRFLEEIPEGMLRHVRPASRRVAGEIRASSPAAPVAPRGWTPPKPPAAQAGGGARFQAGDKVVHRAFGPGTVVAVRGSGQDRVLSVAFPGKGIKDLMESIAPIESA